MEDKPLILTFTGDLCCNNAFARSLEQGGNIIDKNLQNKLSQSDYVIYNFEGSIPENKVFSANKHPVHNAQLLPNYIKSFCKPVFNLANNHTMDYGVIGLTDTLKTLRETDISVFGAGEDVNTAIKPIVLKQDNLTVYIWGFTFDSLQHAKKNKPGTASLKEIGKTIQNKSKKDIHILCIHGGEEYTFFPMPFKRKQIRQIAKKLCPDIIISHHSHTIQGIEKIGNTLIFYSLGNFMFDYEPQKIHDGSDTGLIVTFEISPQKINYTLNGIKVNFQNTTVEPFELQHFPDFEKIINLDNYSNSYPEDAYRVVFGPKNKINSKKNNNQPTAKPTWKLMHKVHILLGIIADRYLLSLYFSALKYKLFKNA